MRFSAVIMAGAFALLSNAQSSVAPSSPEASAQAAIVKCIDACNASDVDCLSHCTAVPNPSPEQVVALNDCVGACPQGSGTAEDTAKYIACQDGCIGKFFYTNTGTPAPTAAAGSNSGSGSGSGGAVTTSPAGTKTQSGSVTAQTTSSKPNAAPVIAGSVSFGLLGLLAAFLL